MSDNARSLAAGAWRGDGGWYGWAEAPDKPRPTEAAQPASPDLTAIKQSSDLHVTQEVVSRLIDRYTADRQLAPLIVRFLDTHWRSYMKQLFDRVGEKSDTWRTALTNTLNLIWSLQPKKDDESRRRLYELLPELFHWIHAVLKSQQVSVPEEDVFFAELASIQVAALSSYNGSSDNGNSAGSADPAANAHGESDSSAGQWGNVADVIAERTDSDDRPTSQPGTAPTAKEMRPGSEHLQGLVVGKYVEFHSRRTTKRVMRLEWISGNGGAYLFRDQGSGDTLFLTADRCIQCLLDHSAAILG